MPLSIGIVGLPNVGKSTLFNAITNASIPAENYPFCTIEPNTGIVPLPDSRLAGLAKVSGSEKLIPATVTFVDIAGLVKGASKGEGLGNKFLSHIRDTSAVAHVVRCFEDDNVTHVSDKLDPIDDAETIHLELILADLDMVQKQIGNQEKKVKANDKSAVAKLALLKRVEGHLAESQPVSTFEFADSEAGSLQDSQFLSAKPVIFVANIAEADIGTDIAHVTALQEYAKKTNSQCLVICAQIEQELTALPEDERHDYLETLGLSESGLDQLSHAAFKLLGLQTYLTTGPKETRAWTINQGDLAPAAAGVIHTDFEDGFIRANIVSYDDFVSCQGTKGAKEKGLLRQEGKDYVMHDGDVVEFLFNV